MLRPIIISLILVLLFSCTNTGDKGDHKVTSREECLTGTWQLLDGGFIKTFRFNPDMTGVETYSETEKKGFVWAITDEHPRLVFDQTKDTLIIELLCQDSLIVVNGFKYRKATHSK